MRVEVIQRPQESVNVVRLPGMDHVEIQRDDRRALKSGRDAPHYDEIDAVRLEAPKDAGEVKRWCFQRATSLESRQPVQ